jgi:xanthine dehydrogenase/oxidase
VRLLRGSANPRAIHSSKAVGEPPFFLASSVYFAIKNAVGSYRAAHGAPVVGWQLQAPATCERIRLACQDAHVPAALPSPLTRSAGGGGRQVHPASRA